MKAYFDLLYQAGAKNVVYADESVKGIPEGTPWEDKNKPFSVSRK